MEAKTLDSSSGYRPYEATRAFWERNGFVHVDTIDPLPAYVRLIHDALTGDRSLFTRPDGLAAAWRTVTPLLTDPPQVTSYAPGSWGPAAARKLIAPGRWLLGQ